MFHKQPYADQAGHPSVTFMGTYYVYVHWYILSLHSIVRDIFATYVPTMVRTVYPLDRLGTTLASKLKHCIWGTQGT